MIVKSLLLFQSLSQDTMMNKVRPKSAITNNARSSALLASPENVGIFTNNPKALAAPSGRQASEANICRQLCSCSSTNSTSSYCSTSSVQCFATSALLHCVWKNDIPYFILSMDEDQGNICVASPWEMKSSSNKSLDYIYLFRSKNHVIGTSDVVGKMRVSSSLFLDSNRSKVMETEFVLFASNEEHSTDKQRSFPSVSKAKGLSKKVTEIFRSMQLSKHYPDQKLGESNSLFEDMQQMFAAEQDFINDTGQVDYIVDDFIPNFELATIIVRDYGFDSRKKANFSGWGLNFLKKVEVDNHANSSSSSFKSSKESSTESSRKSSRNVNVLVPAGIHGGPIARNSGPSSLAERWRSNGHCHCGGWDLGCPLKVLNSGLNCLKHLTPTDPKEYCNSVELFIEGKKQGEPTLKLLSLTEDMYVIYSQPTLSALQSFSISVAIIHSQTPHLYPKF